MKENASGQTSEFVILGAWDFDEEKNIVSYLSPIVQAMLHKKAGEEIEFNGQSYRIESIGPALTNAIS